MDRRLKATLLALCVSAACRGSADREVRVLLPAPAPSGTASSAAS